MTIEISNAIQSLNTKGGNSHEYVMTGTPTNEAEYNSQVKFISGADANGTAIFGTQAYSWSEVSAELTSLQTAYDGLAYARARAVTEIHKEPIFSDLWKNVLYHYKRSKS
jgi:hypothetical protein